MAKQNDRKTKVLIIGGGFAGVSAAAALDEAGEDFELLEASSERLGGRVHSFAYRPGPPGSQEHHFEHGAQYIGAAQTAIFDLVKTHLPHALVDGYAARLAWKDQVMVLRGERYFYDRGTGLFGIPGIPPQLDVWNLTATLLLIQEIEAIERAIDVAEPWNSPPELLALDQITVEQWFSRPWVPPIARDLIVISVQALFSADPSEMSAFYFFWYVACNGGILNGINDEKGGPQQYYLATGFSALLEKMVEPFRNRVHLGSPVQWIELGEKQEDGTFQPFQREDGTEYVKVTLQDGAVWEAQKVVVAMSPNTAGRLNYSPQLPEKRRELMRQPMGRTVKCVVLYDEPWWRDSHGRKYTGYAGGASFPILWVMDTTPTGPGHAGCHALMVMTVGQFVDALGPYPSREAIVNTVTESLSFIFNDERALSTSKHFIDLVSYVWNPAETFVGGGPNTIFTPGLLAGDDCAGRLLNEPWNGKVFFASSETARKLAPTSPAPTWTPGADPAEPGTYSDHRQSLGYMDGAILAGRYVAAQVLGTAPAPGGGGAAPPVFAAEPVMEPQELTMDKVKEVLTHLCQDIHESCAMKIPTWEAPPEPWRQDAAALQAWLAETLTLVLVKSGLLEPPPWPPTPAWLDAFTRAAIAFIGSGYRYWTLEGSDDPAIAQKITSIKELTKILDALMRLKSSEPFSAVSEDVPPGEPEPEPEPHEEGPPCGKFISLGRALCRH